MVRAERYRIAECPVGLLAIMPRPRAGDWLEDEAASWRKQGLDIVVSLLEDDEVAELGLASEEEACAQAGLRFLRLPIPDRGVPSSATAISQLVSVVIMELRVGCGVGLHCRIGVGRSALLAVCVLAALGVLIASAWLAVEKARGLTVPDTPEQREWVARWFTGFQSQIESGGSPAGEEYP